jgi:hypothetical protein
MELLRILERKTKNTIFLFFFFKEKIKEKKKKKKEGSQVVEPSSLLKLERMVQPSPRG